MGELLLSIGGTYFILAFFLGYIWVPLGFLFTLLNIVDECFRKARTYDSEEPVRQPVPSPIKVWMALHCCLTVVPIATVLVSIYSLANRAKSIIGYGPQPMVDDPRLIARGHEDFAQLYDLVGEIYSYAGLAMMTWPVLMLALWRLYTRDQKYALLLAYMAMGLLLRFDPNGCMLWYMD